MSFTLGYFTSSPFGVPAQQTHQGSRYSSKCRCKIDFVLSVPALDPKRYYSVMLCDAGRKDCLRKSLGLDDAAFRKPTRRRGFPLTQNRREKRFRTARNPEPVRLILLPYHQVKELIWR